MFMMVVLSPVVEIHCASARSPKTTGRARLSYADDTAMEHSSPIAVEMQALSRREDNPAKYLQIESIGRAS
jgi:hypothetical protein